MTVPATEPAPTPTPPPAPAPAAPPEPDKGYPENTPVVEMNSEQQAAYYKAQARKHEERNKALGVTPEQLKELRDKASRADALDYELASDKEKAVADARKAAEQEARDSYLPKLVEAEIRAAAAGRIELDKLTEIVGPLDKKWFLAADGTVDTAKVTGYVDSIAPVKGTPPPRMGPTPSGQGQRQGTPGEKSVAAGQDLYAQRHPKKAAV